MGDLIRFPKRDGAFFALIQHVSVRPNGKQGLYVAIETASPLPGDWVEWLRGLRVFLIREDQFDASGRQRSLELGQEWVTECRFLTVDADASRPQVYVPTLLPMAGDADLLDLFPSRNGKVPISEVKFLSSSQIRIFVNENRINQTQEWKMAIAKID